MSGALCSYLLSMVYNCVVGVGWGFFSKGGGRGVRMKGGGESIFSSGTAGSLTTHNKRNDSNTQAAMTKNP